MNPFVLIGLIVFILILLNSVVMSPGLARLADVVGMPRWLGWVPLLNTVIVPRVADANILSWFLLLIPIVNIYVWWDWWGEIAFDRRHPHPDAFALGMFVPVLSAVLLNGFVRSVRSSGSGVRAPEPVPAGTE